ncbi:sensor histidine kinase [Burkholderiaceae bacterium UC74_6]
MAQNISTLQGPDARRPSVVTPAILGGIESWRPSPSSMPVENSRAPRADVLNLVAHELRNALMPIRLAAAQLGSLKRGDDRLPRLRFTIEQQLELMSRLIADLLDNARAESGTLRLKCVDMDMGETLARAVATAAPLVAARSQHFSLHLPSAPGLRFHGDPVRLLQVVVNLLDNASKYTPNGGKISMSVVKSAGRIYITVSDDGIGIAADALPHIFDPFVQTDQAVRFDSSGLGIGLSLVRELVEAHGGGVMACSAGPGCGSQFTVALPISNLEQTIDGQGRVAAALPPNVSLSALGEVVVVLAVPVEIAARA